jgi:hypothetical protein
MPGTRLQGDEWYPVKCDLVAKQVVLDSTAKDGVTLKQDVCKCWEYASSVAHVTMLT